MLDEADEPLPEGCEFVWNAFCALSMTRPVGMGMGAITFTEIKAYQDLYSIQFRTWELDCITGLDHLSRRVMHGD